MRSLDCPVQTGIESTRVLDELDTYSTMVLKWYTGSTMVLEYCTWYSSTLWIVQPVRKGTLSVLIGTKPRPYSFYLTSIGGQVQQIST